MLPKESLPACSSLLPACSHRLVRGPRRGTILYHRRCGRTAFRAVLRAPPLYLFVAALRLRRCGSAVMTAYAGRSPSPYSVFCGVNAFRWADGCAKGAVVTYALLLHSDATDALLLSSWAFPLLWNWQTALSVQRICRCGRLSNLRVACSFALRVSYLQR